MPTKTDWHAIAQELKTIVGERNVLDDPVDLSIYDCDAETLDQAKPDLIVLPGNSREVVEVVRLANRYQVPFTPRGAGTGLSGGATTVMGGISLVLSRMNRVLSVDPEEMVCVVEVGATNSSVSRAAAKYGLLFAPDPSSQNASTIGGNIAENAGGPHTLKYGMTTDHVLGVKFVMPDGEVTAFGGTTVCRLGFDWLGLIVGSEGTLGIATEATLRLTPVPQKVLTMLAYFSSLEMGGQAVSDIVAAGILPAAMEMIDQVTLKAVEETYHLGFETAHGALLIVELDGPELGIVSQRSVVQRCLEKNGAVHITWAKDDAERKRMWQARKGAFGAYGKIAPHAYVLDGVIPRSRLSEAIGKIRLIGEKYNLLIANIYHAGDGNLHPCLLYHRDNTDEVKRVLSAAREILQLCVGLGGTLSGEHGIGIEKALEMPTVFTPEELAVMFSVKRSFDSAGFCNPGKIFPNPKSCGESGMRPLARLKLAASC
jgi:glycolate oxidase subunit GlcD